MINSHYVPQFIIRNFYENGKITYCDMENKTVEPRNSRSVFSEKGFYPDYLEKDLCDKAEHGFANLYHNKMEHARNSLVLTEDELFIAQKFLVVSAVRRDDDHNDLTENNAQCLELMLKRDTIKSLNQILAYEKMNLVEDLWKPLISKFNTLLDPAQTESFDDFNLPLIFEMMDVFHSYLVFVKPRGNEKFLISDTGRGNSFGPLGFRRKAMLLKNYCKQTGNLMINLLLLLRAPRDYSVYPVSKDLAVLTMDSFYKLFTVSEFRANVTLPTDHPTVYSNLGFGDSSIISPPIIKMNGNKKEYHYIIQPLNSKDVAYLNCIMLKQANRYVACSGLETIRQSIDMARKSLDYDYSFMKL